jgi:hypothetical protein
VPRHGLTRASWFHSRPSAWRLRSAMPADRRRWIEFRKLERSPQSDATTQTPVQQDGLR